MPLGMYNQKKKGEKRKETVCEDRSTRHCLFPLLSRYSGPRFREHLSRYSLVRVEFCRKSVRSVNGKRRQSTFLIFSTKAFCLRKQISNSFEYIQLKRSRVRLVIVDGGRSSLVRDNPGIPFFTSLTSLSRQLL